ncbi:MAG: hypothetical protein V4436_00885, partial [Patescibacteria group bacterium]
AMVALAGVVLGLSLFAVAKADSGTQVSICISHSGGVYVIGSGYSKQNCNNNEQLLTLNIQGPQGPVGPQGPAGTPACEGNCQKFLSTDKAVYAVGDPIHLFCQVPDDIFWVYDVTNGIDGDGVNLGSYPCSDPLDLNVQNGHLYTGIELNRFAACSDVYVEDCPASGVTRGRVDFSVQ